MSKTVIKVENLSKQYHLGTVGTGTLSHDINRFWAKVRGKEDPYLQLGDVNNRSVKSNSDLVWALKDINFEVKQGEILGIIGKNGAGKSTLLKILSNITSPTTGRVSMSGRVASLLEVGTGFHPELTGRENIFINGAILGMRKWEIQKQLDEIVDFSGCEKYLDTPVKRYSSGMKVRLGFAVAAHLEPEILIVDEVLSVGDAEFQKKCIGKMQNVSQMDGRTILFVSHNLISINMLCTHSVVLGNGQVEFRGTSLEGIEFYQAGAVNPGSFDLSDLPRVGSLGKIAYINKLKFKGNRVKFYFREVISLEIEYKLRDLNYPLKCLTGLVGIEDLDGRPIYTLSSDFIDNEFSLNHLKQHLKLHVVIETPALNPGKYKIRLGIRDGLNGIDEVVWDGFFEILTISKNKEVVHNGLWGMVQAEGEWSLIKDS